MNALNAVVPGEFKEAIHGQLLSMGLAPLADVAAARDSLRAALVSLQPLGNERTVKRVDRLVRQLDAFEPSVTMIGQIKSGKTSLVNALIGRPDLLPADVNPWTSVVTSLHLSPPDSGFKESASFRFFDPDEWDRLVTGGGRIGEMASRAGADDELEKIIAQAAEMREKSLKRLGQKFEVLLGQQRDYGYFDKQLIERYVCLGDEPDAGDADTSNEQGRFADITKSADLSMVRPALPLPLCVRDTPGVNDTFMMREQITIRSIRDSRLCVVVLSAHQALASTDLALIRLISNVKSRDIVIFVNRIDELAEPAVQVPQIARSIAETLALHKGPQDAQVIFGSALWAGYALDGRLSDLPKSSAKALLEWSDASDLNNVLSQQELDDPVKRAWASSGVPALQLALSNRIAQGVAAATFDRIGKSGSNLASAISATYQMSDRQGCVNPIDKLEIAAARVRVSEIAIARKTELADVFGTILEEFSDRLGRVQENFLDRATATLIVHLEENGDGTPWKYDPAGLRTLLRSSHKVFARKLMSSFDAAIKRTADDYAELNARAFGLTHEQINTALPSAPLMPAPVTLGRTIALDLNGNWWKRWWLQKRGYKAHTVKFRELIKAETNPLIDEMRSELARSVKEVALEAFEAFIHDQSSVFATFDQSADSVTQQRLSDGPEHSDQLVLLDNTLKTLNEYVL